jgi:nucleotide-binding universal stress UspA family protein
MSTGSINSRVVDTGIATLDRGTTRLLKRILVAVAAVPSRRESQLIGEVAEGSRPEIIVLHVREYPFKGSEWMLGGSWLVERRVEASRVLRDSARRLSGAGSPVRTILSGGRHSQVPSIIAKVADEVDADLIVMGQRRHTKFEELLEGALIPKVRHLTGVPILTVPAEIRSSFVG